MDSPGYIKESYVPTEVVDRWAEFIVAAARAKSDDKDMMGALDWITQEWPGPTRTVLSKWLTSD